MFGETDTGESPRMPSPWEAITTATPSPSPSPLALASSTTSLSGSSSDGAWTLDEVTGVRDRKDVSMKYLVETLSSKDDGIGGALGIAGDAFPKLAPEIEQGNVEYKLKLITPTPARFTRLVTQLKYRLLEGGGQALYEIGVSDSGELVGLSRADLEASMDTLERMAGELGATVVVAKEIELPENQIGTKTHFSVPPPRPKKATKIVTTMTGNKDKKEKDKEARRRRRAAALLVGEVGEVREDRDLPLATTDPSEDGVDLSQTITLERPAPTGIPTPSQPMPIIKPYPYGRRPFVMSRAQSSSSVESSTTEQPQEAAVASYSSSNVSTEEYIYQASTSSDSNAVDPCKQSAGDDDDDPAFGFSFDVEIVNFTKDLAPSHHIRSTKPLHHSSIGSFCIATPDLDTPPNRRPLKVAGNKKAIIPSVPPTNPAEKAAERRFKRDLKREEKRRQPPGKKTDNLGETLPAVIVDPPPTGSAPPESLTDQTSGPKFIAEALVVRKLALEEAFLDFGGFGLVEEVSSLGVEDSEETESASD